MDVHSFFVTLKHDPTKETYQGFAHRCEFACEITGQSKNLASGRFVHGVSPDDRIKLESARMGTTTPIDDMANHLSRLMFLQREAAASSAKGARQQEGKEAHVMLAAEGESQKEAPSSSRFINRTC